MVHRGRPAIGAGIQEPALEPAAGPRFNVSQAPDRQARRFVSQEDPLAGISAALPALGRVLAAQQEEGQRETEAFLARPENEVLREQLTKILRDEPDEREVRKQLSNTIRAFQRQPGITSAELPSNVSHYIRAIGRKSAHDASLLLDQRLQEISIFENGQPVLDISQHIEDSVQRVRAEVFGQGAFAEDFLASRAFASLLDPFEKSFRSRASSKLSAQRVQYTRDDAAQTLSSALSTATDLIERGEVNIALDANGEPADKASFDGVLADFQEAIDQIFFRFEASDARNVILGSVRGFLASVPEDSRDEARMLVNALCALRTTGGTPICDDVTDIGGTPFNERYQTIIDGQIQIENGQREQEANRVRLEALEAERSLSQRIFKLVDEAKSKHGVGSTEFLEVIDSLEPILIEETGGMDPQAQGLVLTSLQPLLDKIRTGATRSDFTAKQSVQNAINDTDEETARAVLNASRDQISFDDQMRFEAQLQEKQIGDKLKKGHQQFGDSKRAFREEAFSANVPDRSKAGIAGRFDAILDREVPAAVDRAVAALPPNASDDAKSAAARDAIIEVASKAEQRLLPEVRNAEKLRESALARVVRDHSFRVPSDAIRSPDLDEETRIRLISEEDRIRSLQAQWIDRAVDEGEAELVKSEAFQDLEGFAQDRVLREYGNFARSQLESFHLDLAREMDTPSHSAITARLNQHAKTDLANEFRESNTLLNASKAQRERGATESIKAWTDAAGRFSQSSLATKLQGTFPDTLKSAKLFRDPEPGVSREKQLRRRETTRRSGSEDLLDVPQLQRDQAAADLFSVVGFEPDDLASGKKRILVKSTSVSSPVLRTPPVGVFPIGVERDPLTVFEKIIGGPLRSEGFDVQVEKATTSFGFHTIKYSVFYEADLSRAKFEDPAQVLVNGLTSEAIEAMPDERFDKIMRAIGYDPEDKKQRSDFRHTQSFMNARLHGQ